MVIYAAIIKRGERGHKHMNISRSKNTKGGIKPNIAWSFQPPELKAR